MKKKSASLCSEVKCYGQRWRVVVVAMSLVVFRVCPVDQSCGSLGFCRVTDGSQVLSDTDGVRTVHYCYIGGAADALTHRSLIHSCIEGFRGERGLKH